MEKVSSKTCRSPSIHSVHPRPSTQERSLHTHTEPRVFKFDEELAQEEQRRRSRAPLEVVTSARTPSIHCYITRGRRSQNIKIAPKRKLFTRIGRIEEALQRKPSIQETNSQAQWKRVHAELCSIVVSKEDETPANLQ
jgi:hypothetical protein